MGTFPRFLQRVFALLHAHFNAQRNTTTKHYGKDIFLNSSSLTRRSRREKFYISSIEKMSAATLDFEDVRVLEEKETFELINGNEASTAPQQPPKMLTAPGLMTTGNSNVVEMKFKVGNTKPGASNKNNGKLLLNFESSKRKANASPAFKSNRRKSANGSRSSDLGRIAKEICNQLNEPKVSLMRRALDIVGGEMVSNLAVEVQNIESKGGMQTADGSRRRTPKAPPAETMAAKLFKS